MHPMQSQRDDKIIETTFATTNTNPYPGFNYYNLNIPSGLK